MSNNAAAGLNFLKPFDEKTKDLNVVIETPKGSRNKYTFDEKREIFTLGGVLPLGAHFPFDFGFIPQTLGEDGDPLDVLILMDEPVFPGCLISARLIGVIEANQTEEGKTVRNDRLIAIACESPTHNDVQRLDDLNENLIDQIKHFFISYNEAKGKKFEPLNQSDTKKAERLVSEGAKKYQTKHRHRPVKSAATEK